MGFGTRVSVSRQAVVVRRITAMAAARMSMAVASARFTAVPLRAESNVTRNGAHLSMIAPSVTPASVSYSFSGLTLARRAGANRSGILARAADLEFESSPAAEEPSVAPQEESPPPPPSPEEGTKLYVGNIPWSYDSKQLAEVFQDVGDVELVEVPVIFLHANWLTLTPYPLEAFVKSSDRMLCSMATLSNGI